MSIDFEGSIDGVEFAGGKGENIAIVVGEGRMLPDLEQGLVGAAAGEHRDVEVNFPRRLSRDRAGRQAGDFRDRRQDCRGAALPELDDEFCTSFGVTEGGVRSYARMWPPTCSANSSRTCATAIRTAVHGEALPAQPHRGAEVLIEAQVRDMQIESMRRAGAKDVSQAPPREPFVEPARRRVALGLLLNDVIRREKLVAESGKRVERAPGRNGGRLWRCGRA